ncbi:C-X-C motif chemokine 10-like [Hippoglossus hippoglossus]|uniref:C-X-C motif chemokine 10-like n=1 Tax=Hippoglossus hippoglossus TaxID=8267 RepID=UPI00148BCDFC|nr:C-X-C motif chemokine 10-like [Hippoglossus hippoglossus]
MNSSAITFLSFLLVLCAQGLPDSRSRKCKCLNGYIGKVNPQLISQIKSEPVIHHPNIFCQQIEIIIIIRKQEKCVNPESPFGKRILKNRNKHENKRAAIMTTTSSQTNTWSSTRLLPTDSAPTTM